MINGYNKTLIPQSAQMERKEIMTRHEIFQMINDRQLSALMFHDQMADMYDFLGYHGFKRMHEYQSIKETAERRGLKRYFMNRVGKFLINGDVHDVDVIPSDWVNYTRYDVNPQMRQQTVQKSFEMYKNWEEETKIYYEKYAKMLLDMDQIADFEKIKSLICCVDMELKKLERMLIKLKTIDFNLIYLASIQDEMHEKYKCKTKEIGVNIC